jgi:hypothetical protein
MFTEKKRANVYIWPSYITLYYEREENFTDEDEIYILILEGR